MDLVKSAFIFVLGILLTLMVTTYCHAQLQPLNPNPPTSQQGCKYVYVVVSGQGQWILICQ